MRTYAKEMKPPMDIDVITNLAFNSARYKTTVIDGQIGVNAITKEEEQSGKSRWWEEKEGRQ